MMSRWSLSESPAKFGMIESGEKSRGCCRCWSSHSSLRLRPMYERSGPVRSEPRIIGLSCV